MANPFVDWIVSNASSISAVISAVATLLLVGLYRQQHKILKIQTLPSLEISDEHDGDEVTVIASNYGDGLAKDLRIETLMEFPTLPDKGPYRAEIPLRRETEDRYTVERSIQPKERGIRFSREPPFPIPNGNPYGDFSSGIHWCIREDISKFNFELQLKYKNQLDEEKSSSITHGKRHVELDEEDVEKIDSGELTLNYERCFSLGKGI